MRSLTQARNNLVSEPIMTASSSSTAEQQLECLEARLEADRQEMLARREADTQEMQELFAAMNSRFDQLSEERRTNTRSCSVNRRGGSRIARTGYGTGGFTAP
jgi:hypothetical protein